MMTSLRTLNVEPVSPAMVAAAPVASTSTSSEGQPTRTSQAQEEESLLDLSIFKELGRKALVDVLNSVRYCLSYWTCKCLMDATCVAG